MRISYGKFHKEIVKDYYNVLELRSKYFKQVYDSFKIHRKFSSYLDIGCGRGFNTVAFGKGINTVIAIENSLIDLAEAKNNLKGTNIKLEFGDITDLQFNDKEFDLITVFSVLEHIEKIDQALIEIKRVLTDDGILIIQQPNNRFIVELHTYLPFTFLIPNFIKFPLFRKLGFSDKDIHATILSIKKLLNKLNSKGFEVRLKKMIYPKEIMPRKAKSFYNTLLKLKIFTIIPFGYLLVCEKIPIENT